MKAVSGEPEPYPVEAGVWVVVLGELCVFTLFFTTFLYYRALSPELFEESRALLRQDLGALNTIILLTSSWCVASAVKALRSTETRPRALPLLVGALACGAAFVVVKVFEYGGAINDGINVLTDGFFMFYFMLTGIHLLHLLVGMALLGALTLHLRKALASDSSISEPLVGFASCFWHMLDLVWIILFPLLYLLH
jgi:nitric oxide reductase NorE protein